ncbi:MAG: F0F1 ATP synthase subunit delta [Polyangiaceae bacterium]|nr:F0F1 ATP synthase subunit delta [Polyangiaceae bacterium]
MSSRAVAQRYARALFEVGREGGSLERLVRDLSAFADVARTSADFRAMAESPAFTEAMRTEVLGEIGGKLGVAPETLRLVQVLADNGRLAALADVADELALLMDVEQGIVRATVRSAVPLKDDYRDRLRRRIEEATGKKVLVHYEVDASLIGGVVTEIGDRVIDGSVRGKLERLGESLRQG